MAIKDSETLTHNGEIEDFKINKIHTFMQNSKLPVNSDKDRQWPDLQPIGFFQQGGQQHIGVFSQVQQIQRLHPHPEAFLPFPGQAYIREEECLVQVGVIMDVDLHAPAPGIGE